MDYRIGESCLEILEILSNGQFSPSSRSKVTYQHNNVSCYLHTYHGTSDTTTQNKAQLPVKAVGTLGRRLASIFIDSPLKVESLALNSGERDSLSSLILNWTLQLCICDSWPREGKC